jgi:putative acetyltransferase
VIALEEIELKHATDGELVDVARLLFTEYLAAINIDLEYQGFSAELAGLPHPYTPPAGALFVAMSGNEPMGCVGLRRLNGERCEMKRLYVRPAAQGAGLGRRLVEAVIAAARAAGYRELVLDTLASMQTAQALYRRLGFVEVAPYGQNYLPNTVFYALNLLPGESR